MADGAMRGALHQRWVIDRRSDLLWLVGGALVSYALLAAHVVGGVRAGALWWIWVIALDGPHVFATLSRTYLDPEEWASRRRLLLGSLLWIGLGPACFAIAATAGSRAPFDGFVVFASLWAHYHVVRQHYGVLVLHQRKAGELDARERRSDAALLYVGLFAPFAAFALVHPEARAMMGLGPVPGPERWISWACWAAVAAVAVAWAAGQRARLRQGLPLDAGKLRFFAALLPSVWLLFSPWVAARVELPVFAVVITAYHNVQYQALVWFYHRNRRASARGIARRLASRFWIFALAGVAFAACYRLAGCGLGAALACEGLTLPRKFADGSLGGTELALGCLWGIALHHYYLDQKIWRLRKDPALRRDLRLS